MIKNIIFDYGKVLVNWNPYFQFDPFFADKQKCKYFLEEILTDEWYIDGDIGKPMEELIEKWSARYPEFAEAFRFYVDGFEDSISGEVHMLKPNPDIYEYFLERYSLKPEECVFIDDCVENIVGAALVGIKGIVFEDAGQLSAELEPLLSGENIR